MKSSKLKRISEELAEDIKNKKKEVDDFFGLEISEVDASKIISWKAKKYNVQLTAEKLIEILGGKVAKKIK
jgi:hypothetical protein